MSPVKLIALLSLILSSTFVWAENDDDSYSSFDSLVSELKASAEDIEPAAPITDWEEVALHAGVGIVTSFVNITSPEGESGAGVMKGFVAHFGANLFTKKARAEVLLRNYAAETLSTGLTADLREFELRFVFLPLVQDKMRLRAGAGFSARYMEITARTATSTHDHSISTPATSLMLGFERKLTPTVTIGPDLTYRSALVGETFDKSAWDASLNVNATF